MSSLINEHLAVALGRNKMIGHGSESPVHRHGQSVDLFEVHQTGVTLVANVVLHFRGEFFRKAGRSPYEVDKFTPLSSRLLLVVNRDELVDIRVEEYSRR